MDRSVNCEPLLSVIIFKNWLNYSPNVLQISLRASETAVADLSTILSTIAYLVLHSTIVRKTKSLLNFLPITVFISNNQTQYECLYHLSVLQCYYQAFSYVPLFYFDYYFYVVSLVNQHFNR